MRNCRGSRAREPRLRLALRLRWCRVTYQYGAVGLKLPRSNPSVCDFLRAFPTLVFLMSRIGGSRIETGIHSIIMRMGTIFIYREPCVVKLHLRAAEVCPLV